MVCLGFSIYKHRLTFSRKDFFISGLERNHSEPRRKEDALTFRFHWLHSSHTCRPIPLLCLLFQTLEPLGILWEAVAWFLLHRAFELVISSTAESVSLLPQGFFPLSRDPLGVGEIAYNTSKRTWVWIPCTNVRSWVQRHTLRPALGRQRQVVQLWLSGDNCSRFSPTIMCVCPRGGTHIDRLGRKLLYSWAILLVHVKVFMDLSSKTNK